jgi:hypothetical protein
MGTFSTSFIPAAHMGDEELRRELAVLHGIANTLAAQCQPAQRETLDARLSELDAEYLRRFPAARASWPWPMPPASCFRPM